MTIPTATHAPPIGVLLLQLGTPDNPSVPAVRRYLRQFLSDRRVIEAPRLVWWPVLNLQVLRTRPKESAAKYRRIWDTKTGFPLRHYSQRLVDELQKVMPDGVLVRYGMRYGHPSIRAAVHELVRDGVERLIVLPLYPQYSATTTASALDGLFKALRRERRVPAIRVVPPYYAHAAYIEAMSDLVKEEESRLSWRPEHYLLSFHGIPLAYTQKGDPYAQHVEQTTRQLLRRLDWPHGQWTQCYQSLFGREEWLRPYTHEVMIGLAKRGVRKILVATPGFTADCLETIDEIGYEFRELYKAAGGEEYHRCPCLNDREQWVRALRRILFEEGRGWLPSEAAEGS